jgi:hypothetical protein
VVNLSRNFGKEIALTAGLDPAKEKPLLSSTRTYRIHRN